MSKTHFLYCIRVKKQLTKTDALLTMFLTADYTKITFNYTSFKNIFDSDNVLIFDKELYNVSFENKILRTHFFAIKKYPKYFFLITCEYFFRRAYRDL